MSDESKPPILNPDVTEMTNQLVSIGTGVTGNQAWACGMLLAVVVGCYLLLAAFVGQCWPIPYDPPGILNSPPASEHGEVQ